MPIGDLLRWDVSMMNESLLSHASYAAMESPTRLRNGLVVKESAVIQSPEGPYVLIASADRRTFTKRPVQIGATMYDYADVIGGAREDEYAVALHTFALDTERRLGRRAAR